MGGGGGALFSFFLKKKKEEEKEKRAANCFYSFFLFRYSLRKLELLMIVMILNYSLSRESTSTVRSKSRVGVILTCDEGVSLA